MTAVQTIDLDDKKRSLDEIQVTEQADSDVLLKRLRALDPDISPLDYWVESSDDSSSSSSEDDSDEDSEGGFWDYDGLKEDVQLTEQYKTSGLESTLLPMRCRMQRVLAKAPIRVDMLSDVAEVLPGNIVLGNAIAARNVDLLKRLRVRSVLNMSPQTVRTSKAFYDQVVKGQILDYQEIWADDLLDYCIMDHFDTAWASYAAALKRHGEGGRWFVHCEQGINRSGALVTAIQMRVRLAEQHKHAAEGKATPARTAEPTDIGQLNTEPDPEPDEQTPVRADEPGGVQLLSPEDLLWESWRCVSERRGGPRGAVTNTAFQRQLLLFARLGCQWWKTLPSICAIWRTPHEHAMAAFRVFVDGIAWRVVHGSKDVLPQDQKFFATLIRDGAMRGEAKLQNGVGFNIDEATGARAKAEKRVTWYATKYLDKKVKALQKALQEAKASIESKAIAIPL